MKITEGKLYKTKEVAEIMGVSRQTILAWINKGILPAIQPADRYKWRIKGRDIIKLLGGK